MTAPSPSSDGASDAVWRLDALLEAGPTARQGGCACANPPLALPSPSLAGAEDDALLAWLDAPSRLCGCSPDCACGCMDWLQLPQSPSHTEAAAAAAAVPAAPQLAPLPAAVVSRCLDSTHAGECATCVPPPHPEEEASTELAASDGRTGEKRLRALLTRTPEWNSQAAREQAAQQLLAERGTAGGSETAEALKRRESARLRKCDLLFLARHWRYRSDVWRPRQQRPVHRRQPRPAQGRCGAGSTKGACGCSGATASSPDLGWNALLDALATAAVKQPASATEASQLRLTTSSMRASAAQLRGTAGEDMPLWQLGPAFTAAESDVDALCSMLCARAIQPDASRPGQDHAAGTLLAARLARASKAQLALIALQPASKAAHHAAVLLDALAAFATRSMGDAVH